MDLKHAKTDSHTRRIAWEKKEQARKRMSYVSGASGASGSSGASSSSGILGIFQMPPPPPLLPAPHPPFEIPPAPPATSGQTRQRGLFGCPKLEHLPPQQLVVPPPGPPLGPTTASTGLQLARLAPAAGSAVPGPPSPPPGPTAASTGLQLTRLAPAAGSAEPQAEVPASLASEQLWRQIRTEISNLRGDVASLREGAAQNGDLNELKRECSKLQRLTHECREVVAQAEETTASKIVRLKNLVDSLSEEITALKVGRLNVSRDANDVYWECEACGAWHWSWCGKT